ncbi:choice-of-anchor B family protein [Cellvibrio sp. OA-2007]|uniref:choice-of-anchor B family protein n=1 Tax=Cellvibrio sp. OA-2007 TaxID=529823 RepID=UPI000780C3A2|nr:choice-of-anchor B family protein [Cellvibrio sp. OA-2007]
MINSLGKYRFLFLFALVHSPVQVLAHAEHDKERYVAVDGVDEGRCDQKTAPCNTIAYAAKQAGKGDKILVAEGRYDIADVDSIFYLAGSAVPVTAGYQKGSYKPSAQTGNTILVGVPPEFSAGLAQKGFTVIADTKGLNREQQQYLNAKQTQVDAMAQAQVAVPCVAGKAGEFSCNKLDLLAHVPLATLGNSNSRGNDIWGHFDLNDQREYALVGLTNGVSVVEVTDPLNPRIVNFIASQNTIWRDLKTYQYFDQTRRRWMSYAYVTADAASVGTMILDLTQLPEKVVQLSSEKTDTSAHNIYISNVDYSTGVALTGRTPYLHVAGSDKQGGAFNTYSLANPISPVSVYKNAANSRNFYSHDVSSLWIGDARREQCVDKNNDCDLLLDYNEDEILLWDKTDNAKPFNLARSTYQYVSYVHSGWWTEDRQFITVHDELDEQRYSLNTRVRFFAINNLRAPELAGEYIGPTAAIDHNGYTRGNRYYISNYERGLVVLDISDPRKPVEAGFFDTYPLANSASFNGAWGTYPFLPSGNIVVSDINSGLYVIRDNTAGAQGSVKFSGAQRTVKEGDVVRLSLMRIGGNVGAVEVFFETQTGNADAADFTMSAGSVSWGDGDSSEKIIEIPIVADGADNEFTETFFVRLFNPRNGLMLASPNLVVINIADKPDEPVVLSSSSSSSSATASSIASSLNSTSSVIASSGQKSTGGGSIPALFIVALGILFVVKRITRGE